jgi:hypothetical protein
MVFKAGHTPHNKGDSGPAWRGRGRTAIGALEERVRMLRDFVPWPALIESWERDLARARQGAQR